MLELLLHTVSMALNGHTSMLTLNTAYLHHFKYQNYKSFNTLIIHVKL